MVEGCKLQKHWNHTCKCLSWGHGGRLENLKFTYLPLGKQPTRVVRTTKRPTPVKARVTLSKTTQPQENLNGIMHNEVGHLTHCTCANCNTYQAAPE